MTRRPDAAGQLLRALARSAVGMGCTADLRHEVLTPWASATFVGGQHRVLATGPGLDRWLDTLAEADLPMIGHFVADCAVERGHGGALLTILVLEA